MNFNQAMIAGRLTRDPELRYTPSGTAVCSFSVATDRKWKDKDGNDQKDVLFMECSAFSGAAETLSQWLKKGSPIFVVGYLKLNEWEDRNTGEKRSKIVLNVEKFQFVPDGKKDNRQTKQEGYESGPRMADLPPGLPLQKPGKRSMSSGAASEFDTTPPEDDVPF